MSNIMTIVAGCVMTLACASCARSFLSVTKVRDYGRAFWSKGAAGLCFVALGLLGATRCGDAAFAWKIAAALLLGLIGDQLLALRFLKTESGDALFAAGALAFALGHGLYIWALLSRTPSALALAGILAALLFAGSLIWLKRMSFDAGKLRAAAFGYLAVVIFMGSLALASAVKAPSVSSLLFALGGLCFIVSDDILCEHNFGRDRRFGLDVAVHVTYYAAQLLIGWSLFFMG